MENSAGSADREMGKIEDSIEYKVNKLNETWTGFAQDFISRDFVKGCVDALTAVSSAITSFLSVLQPAGTIFASFVAGFGLFRLKQQKGGGRAKNSTHGYKKVNYPPSLINFLIIMSM